MPSDLEASFASQAEAQGIQMESEYRFHPTRRWRFDFAIPDVLLGIEIEGGTWVSGRHSRGPGFEKDCEKYSEAAILGWRVLRFNNHMVNDGRAVEYLMRALAYERLAG